MRQQPPSNESEAILNELLVLRCRHGDADAWRELVRIWERRLLYYLRRLLNDERDAWDALQQTWLDAFRNQKTLRNPRALRPWIYQIAHRRAIGGIDSIRGVGLTVIGIVFLIGAGVLLLRTVIEQSELRTHEKLLEMELRLTRITDELIALRREKGE